MRDEEAIKRIIDSADKIIDKIELLLRLMREITGGHEHGPDGSIRRETEKKVAKRDDGEKKDP